MKKQYISWGAAALSSALTTLLFPIAVAAVGPTVACASVVIDNDTADWTAVNALATDGPDIAGTDYYYDGTNWSTTPSDNDVYSTNLDKMMDLETIKVCNSATQLQFYIDAYHPLFGLEEVATGDFYEFGDPTGPGEEVGMPVDFDNWLVVKMQEASGEPIYYYAVHLVAPQDDAGMLEGPTETSLYEESDGTNFASANFNPNDDTLIIEFQPEDQGDGPGSKEIDFEGGFEADVTLVNGSGNDLFNMTNISYGDSLRMAVLTYSNAEFNVSTLMAAHKVQGNVEALDSTERATLTIRKVGVTGVVVPNNKRHDNSVLVQWDKIKGATNYTLYVHEKGTILYQSVNGSKKSQKRLTELKPNTRYDVRVRAIFVNKDTQEALLTPWSERTNFKTRP